MNVIVPGIIERRFKIKRNWYRREAHDLDGSPSQGWLRFAFLLRRPAGIRQRKLWLEYGLVVLVLLLFVPTFAGAQVRDDGKTGPRFTVSKKTTFVLEPLRPDGSVDFAAAINTRLGAKITAKENAAVPFYQAIGPAPGGYELPDAFFAALGMEKPSKDGQYLVPLASAIDEWGLSDAEQTRVFQQLDIAMERPWSRDEFPTLAKWLDQNKKPLSLLQAAAGREEFFSPLLPADEHIPEPLVAFLLPGAAASRSAARMLCVRAMQTLKEGDAGAAWNDVMAGYRLGRLAGKGPTLTEGLSGYGIERMSYESAVRLFGTARVSSEQAIAFRKMLDSLPVISSLRDKANLTERCQCLDALLVMAFNDPDAVELLDVEDGLGAAGRIVNRFGLTSIDWDGALVAANSWYDRLVAALDEPAHSLRRKNLRRFERELKQLRDRIKGGDLLASVNDPTEREKALAKMVGDVVAATLISEIIEAQTAADLARQRVRNLHVALALVAFRSDAGHYPDQLEQLSPKWMGEIPNDLFTDRALVYRRTDAGCLLYSCGPNRRDNGGQTSEEKRGSDDLPIRLN